MAEEYAGHDQPLSEQMDISNELANQVAAEAVAAAVAAHERDRHPTHDPSQPHQHTPHSTSAHHAAPTHHHHSQSHSQAHAQTHTHAHNSDLPQPGQGPPPPPAYQRSRPASGTSASPLPFPFGPPHRQAPDSPLTNSQQLMVLREFYARNPNPSKKELEMLAERTGRPWNKIREYFRQRRNKLRGLSDLEGMEEPGRASSWLQVTYRPGPSTAAVSQLSLYNAYKTRFDPYSTTSPLLGGQELIQLACSTFPGCEMARDDGDYVLRGLRDKDGVAVEAEWDRSVDAMVEPLRGATWLLSSFQHQADPSAPPSLSQTELYTAYAARFSSLLPDGEGDGEEQGGEGSGGGGLSGLSEEMDAAMGVGVGVSVDVADQQVADAELKDFEANMANEAMTSDDINSFLPPPPELESESGGGGQGGEHGEHGHEGHDGRGHGHDDSHGGQDHNGHGHAHDHGHGQHEQDQEQTEHGHDDDDDGVPPRPARLLNPVELIALARMTFPKCEPALDDQGRFVIRGIERRDAVERGRGVKPADMFPFALATAPSPSDPSHPFTSLLKRKLALLNPDPDEPSKRRASPNAVGTGIGVNLGLGGVNLDPADGELADEDRELIDGLRRFRHSRLGREVRDVCVQQ